MTLKDLGLTITEKRQTPIPLSGSTITGYGSRLATSHLIRLSDSKKWYRIYCICYSNVGGCYIRRHKEQIFINDCDMP